MWFSVTFAKRQRNLGKLLVYMERERMAYEKAVGPILYAVKERC